MFTFRGGRDVQTYPVSDDQAISEINESLGLGIEQFIAGKKIAMLNAPAKYLQEKNDKLAGLTTAITNDYKAALEEIQNLAPGYESSLWVIKGNDTPQPFGQAGPALVVSISQCWGQSLCSARKMCGSHSAS